MINQISDYKVAQKLTFKNIYINLFIHPHGTQDC